MSWETDFARYLGLTNGPRSPRNERELQELKERRGFGDQDAQQRVHEQQLAYEKQRSLERQKAEIAPRLGSARELMMEREAQERRLKAIEKTSLGIEREIRKAASVERKFYVQGPVDTSMWGDALVGSGLMTEYPGNWVERKDKVAMNFGAEFGFGEAFNKDKPWGAFEMSNNALGGWFATEEEALLSVSRAVSSNKTLRFIVVKATATVGVKPVETEVVKIG